MLPAMIHLLTVYIPTAASLCLIVGLCSPHRQLPSLSVTVLLFLLLYLAQPQVFPFFSIISSSDLFSMDSKRLADLPDAPQIVKRIHSSDHAYSYPHIPADAQDNDRLGRLGGFSIMMLKLYQVRSDRLAL